jgi:hypothetical protein
MENENVVYIHNGVLFSLKDELNYVVCRKMDGTEDHMLSEINQSESQISHVFTHMWNVDL